MKTITKSAIKAAFESNRKLQQSSYQDWDNDNEAKLINAVRSRNQDYDSGLETKTQSLKSICDELAGKKYSDLPDTIEEVEF